MTASIALRNSAQVALYGILVHELTAGHWQASSPHGHSEFWAGAKPTVARGDEVGYVGEPARIHYDLLNKEFVDGISKKGVKALKEAGVEEPTETELRRQLRDMMMIMRTPKGAPLAESNQGKIGSGHRGRPSKELLETIAKKAARSASAKRSRSKRAKAA
jgi:hypothetical protein